MTVYSIVFVESKFESFTMYKDTENALKVAQALRDEGHKVQVREHFIKD